MICKLYHSDKESVAMTLIQNLPFDQGLKKGIIEKMSHYGLMSFAWAVSKSKSIDINH